MSGVRVDRQYVGYLKELKRAKKILLLPGEHEIIAGLIRRSPAPGEGVFRARAAWRGIRGPGSGGTRPDVSCRFSNVCV